jgi:hypothetical protein
MRKDAEHAAGDADRPYCRSCARKDGELKSYDEVLAKMTVFMRQARGLGEEKAQQAARKAMERMPAWKGRSA